MKNLYIHFVLLVALAAITLHFVPGNSVDQKVGYVKSQDLIYGYAGTKDIQNKFNLKVQIYEAQLDTLKSDYQYALSNYQKNLPDLSDAEKAEREQLLIHQEQNIRSYQAELENKIKAEEQQMMEGVLNQINSFIERYAKDNNLSIVLGTTTQGNILYGNEAMDITEDLLNKLNEQY